MGLRQWLYSINEKISEHACKNAYPDATFAIFGIITYPLYYWIWTTANRSGYDNLTLRLIVVLLCVGLLLKKYWPANLINYYSLYWYITILYSLPLLFTFLLLKNELSQAWVLNSMTILVLSILLLDLTALLIIIPVGIGLGILLFLASGGDLHDKSNHISILITYGSVIFFGAIFSYRKDQLKEAEKKLKKSEAERLRVEMESSKLQLETQRLFNKTANQVAHDIRSPLASMLMIVKSCTDIPEMERIALRDVAQSINDIADSLLSQYKPVIHQGENRESQTALLTSAVLLQILTDKKFQYKDRRVRFLHEFSESGQFAFIMCPLSSFKRMISNLINNAIDSVNKIDGKITVCLDATDKHVIIDIVDNGSGMPIELIERIKQKKPVTFGKESGHGIGLSQVHETLEDNCGSLLITSIEGKGSKVTVQFPYEEAPNWIAKNLQLYQNDTIIILDDDRSIHGAWNSRFENFLKTTPTITIKHFEKAVDALLYITDLSIEEKERLLLLTDFELVKQNLNGLDVIEKTQVQRSILVTSHYMDTDIQTRAVFLNACILPKLLASEIPIEIIVKEKKIDYVEMKIVDAIIVDDDEVFAQSLIKYVFTDNNVDYFNSPASFLANIMSYPKDTRIYLDNFFDAESVDGMHIATELHELGYKCLYLLSGKQFNESDIPPYLKVILKNDIDSIKDW